MKLKIILILVILTSAVSFLVLKYEGIFYQPTGKLKVVTTLFPYYDFSRIIGGDKADVSLLLPPGVEAHSFEPKPSDILKINNSDIFIYTGDFMEIWPKDILDGINNSKLFVVRASDGIKLLTTNKAIDPHIWLDFTNSQKIVDNILLAFLEKDGQNKDFYIKNADSLKASLADLDESFKSGLSDCRTKSLVYGGHYAFGYLVKRYGLNYYAAQGLAPDSEPTAQDLSNLIKEIKINGIKYVFYEELSSPKIAETISVETGAKLLFLNAAHNVSREDLNKGVSFIDIMKEDLNNIKIGLECR